MSKILLIEDEKPISVLICDILEMDKHVVESVHNGLDGMDRLKFYTYDLVILDWGLPEMTGMEICKTYRASGGKIPILLLTGRDQLSDKEQGFEAGVDDYITKPFNLQELRARVRALLRRAPEHSGEAPLSFGSITLDSSTYLGTLEGKNLELLPLEFNLLWLLMKHAGEVVSTETIFDQVWGDSGPSQESLRACVKRLRKKIEVPGSGCSVRSVYGKGYLLEARAD